MTSKLFFTISLAVLFPAILIIIDQGTLFSRSKPDVAAEAENTVSNHINVLPIVDAVGPESIAFDPAGEGPYTGVSDGRIIKWQRNERRWIDFGTTSPNSREGCEGEQDHQQTEQSCGRPLGMFFKESSGDLYIADAYMGLLKVGPEGGLATRIATHAQGVPFGFTNSLDIDQSDGVVYFTDSSARYQRRNYISVILSGDKTGRLMKYDPHSDQVTVLLCNLSFPNGVALSKDGNYLIFGETTSCRIRRYWLKTTKAGTLETFAELQGFPDNIKRSPRGGYWVAMHSRREKILSWIVSRPWLGNALLRLPIDIMKFHSSVLSRFRGGGFAVRLSEDGQILETLEEDKEKAAGDYRLRSISEVQEEKDGTLWVGSISSPFVGVYKITDVNSQN